LPDRYRGYVLLIQNSSLLIEKYSSFSSPEKEKCFADVIWTNVDDITLVLHVIKSIVDVNTSTLDVMSSGAHVSTSASGVKSSAVYDIASAPHKLTSTAGVISASAGEITSAQLFLDYCA